MISTRSVCAVACALVMGMALSMPAMAQQATSQMVTVTGNVPTVLELDLDRTSLAFGDLDPFAPVGASNGNATLTNQIAGYDFWTANTPVNATIKTNLTTLDLGWCGTYTGVLPAGRLDVAYLGTQAGGWSQDWSFSAYEILACPTGFVLGLPGGAQAASTLPFTATYSATIDTNAAPGPFSVGVLMVVSS